VGLSACALARMAVAGRVYCIGAPAARLATARAMGADETLDFQGVEFEGRLE